MNELAAIFKALSDETRFELVNVLLTQDLCVGAFLARRPGHIGSSRLPAFETAP